MNSEAPQRFESPRRMIRNVLHLLASTPLEGPPNEVLRVGGGVNVAVFPLEPGHPERLTEQTVELMRGRAAYRLPFDEPGYVSDSDALNVFEI